MSSRLLVALAAVVGCEDGGSTSDRTGGGRPDGGQPHAGSGGSDVGCDYLIEDLVHLRWPYWSCTQLGDQWSCLCEVDAVTYDPETGDPAVVRAVAETSADCDRALELICDLPEDHCAEPQRECTRASDDHFECMCGPRARAVDAAACHAALTLACACAAQCTSYLGTCDETADGAGVECGCVDGSRGSAVYDVSTSTCQDALASACADAEVPAEAHCTATSGDYEGRCQWHEPTGTTGYDCTCIDRSRDGGAIGSTGTGPLDAATCREALQQVCPLAVEG